MSSVAVMEKQTSTIFDNAVALVVDMGKLGSTRKLGGGAVEVEGTDKDRVRASKKLFQCEEYDDINRFDIATRAVLNRRTVSAKMFRDGVWMVKTEHYLDLVSILKDRRIERNLLVNAFMDKYEHFKSEDKKALGPNYDPADYPTEDEARARFRLDWYCIEFSTPKSLNSISRKAYEEEVASMKRTVGDLTKDCERILCMESQAVLDHMLEALAGGPRGKPRKFNSSIVEKAVQFFSDLPGRNITDQEELTSIAKSAKALLQNVDPQDLRDSSSLRKSVVGTITEIKQQVNALLVDKPARAIAFKKKEA